MNLIDIHSHILPDVDDGARTVEESIELLKSLKAQGVTDVIATPHFIANEQNLDEFFQIVKEASEELFAATQNLDLPNVYLGSEVYYFAGIGKSKAISTLCLNKTKYLLLELPTCTIDKYILDDIKRIRTELGLIPIIAHIERYAKEKGFKHVLSLIDGGVCLAQLNATSLFMPQYKKISYKLIKKGYISFIATDTHSLRHRPPMLDSAFDAIETNLGKNYSALLLENSDYLQKEITNA